MQNRLATLDKGIRNTLGHRQQFHPFYLIKPGLVHGIAISTRFFLYFPEHIQGNLGLSGLIQSAGQAIAPYLL